MEKKHSSVDLFCSILFYVGEIAKNTTFDSIYPTILKNNLSLKIDETISAFDKEKSVVCQFDSTSKPDIDKLISILELLREGYIGCSEDEKMLFGKREWGEDVMRDKTI